MNVVRALLRLRYSMVEVIVLSAIWNHRPSASGVLAICAVTMAAQATRRYLGMANEASPAPAIPVRGARP